VGVKNQIPKCFNFKQLKQSATINVYDLPQQRHHLFILRKIANTLMADGMTFDFSLSNFSLGNSRKGEFASFFSHLELGV
jgi:hypothetical protein